MSPVDHDGQDTKTFDFDTILNIRIPRSLDQLKKSFHRWRKTKLIAGGVSRLTRSIMYLMIMVITIMEGGLDELFPSIFGIIIGLRGIHLFISGSFKLYRAKGSVKRTRAGDIIVSPAKILAYRALSLIYLIPFLTYLFILPTLITPLEISSGYEWYIWPLIFILYWLIWRLVLRALIRSYFRAYLVGNKLARVHHDKRMIRRGFKDAGKNLKLLINTSYIPIISLLIVVILAAFLKVVYSLFRAVFLDSITVDTIADLIIDTILSGNFSLNETLFPNLPIWMTPLLLYLLNISLIFIGSYTRSRIRSLLFNKRGFKSTMGRLIDIFMDDENTASSGKSGESEDGTLLLERGK